MQENCVQLPNLCINYKETEYLLQLITIVLTVTEQHVLDGRSGVAVLLIFPKHRGFVASSHFLFFCLG